MTGKTGLPAVKDGRPAAKAGTGTSGSSAPDEGLATYVEAGPTPAEDAAAVIGGVAWRAEVAHTGQPAAGQANPAAQGGEPAMLLDNPVALRALAHPARQRLVAEMYAGSVLTATEAAELVGLTPSAVSHHLRALAKYGLAERAEPTSDGRERPWRAAGSELSLGIPSGSASIRALQAVTRTAITAAAAELDALLEGRVGEPWKGHRGISREALWLTREETAELGESLNALLERFVRGRHAGNHPPGSRRTEFTVLFLPLEPPPDVPPDDADDPT